MRDWPAILAVPFGLKAFVVLWSALYVREFHVALLLGAVGCGFAVVTGSILVGAVIQRDDSDP